MRGEQGRLDADCSNLRETRLIPRGLRLPRARTTECEHAQRSDGHQLNGAIGRATSEQSVRICNHGSGRVR
eukprot:scaffold3719_cov247-Pinguiococcus_pyrenoidosus.AAC.22